MPKDKQEPGEWAVFDLNARSVDPNDHSRVLPRHHDSRLGVSWPLRCNEPCHMPEVEARVFLKDPAFKVVNDEGEEVPPLTVSQQSRNLPAVLAPNLVVASLAELTTDALLTRSAQMRGGQYFNSTTHREKLIKFLIERQTAKDAVLKPGESLADHEMDDLDDADAARMLMRAA
jgi:hypothetical protein